MYKVGDLIIYGNTGVCRIVDITARNAEEAEQEQLFYVLMPLYQNCTIITPINNTKVYMRPVITKEQAKLLIAKIPTIHVEPYHNRAINQLAEHYKESLNSHDCYDLLKLCMSLYTKKQNMEHQKRKFGVVDGKFMKRAEELLFGELAVVFEIDKEQVPAFIAAMVTDEKVQNAI